MDFVEMNDDVDFAEMNTAVFAVLNQYLDDKILSFVIKDARNNGRIFREHSKAKRFLSIQKNKPISLL